MSRKRKSKATFDMNIAIPFTGETYERTEKGRKIINAFGRPNGHGVGMGMEDFAYYDIPMIYKSATIRLANKIVGKDGVVDIY
jgi:hypothetical protein